MRPVPSAAPVLADVLLTPDVDFGVRVMDLAHALGVSGFDGATAARLFQKLSDPEPRDTAALALVLGGSADTAARTVARYADFGRSALDALQDLYFRAFGYWSDEDLQQGRVYRWVDNALAVGHVEIDGVRQDWARRRLADQLDNLQFDNGPHSMTRTSSSAIASSTPPRSGEPATKRGAILTLQVAEGEGRPDGAPPRGRRDGGAGEAGVLSEIRTRR